MLTKLRRCLKIYWVIVYYRLDRFYPALRYIVYLNPYCWFNRHYPPRTEAVRLALTALGPVFIKLGQTLSTRRDLLSTELADELAKLQDQVPPFKNAAQVLTRIYGEPFTNLFAEFDETPIAAASIAQVHSARLKDGTPVVVKILRPHIRRPIHQDLAVLRGLARCIQSISKFKRFKAREIVAEFTYCLYRELDLLQEAASATQLKRNFEHSQTLYIPKIYWPESRTEALVMERIEAIAIRDLVTLDQVGVPRQILAERIIEIFLTQVFDHCFFHADMHPGNIFVDATFSHHPRYILVDFGIMGTLNAEDQRYIAENFLAFFNRDYRRVAQLHIAAGWAPANTRLDRLEMAIRAVCEPMFERPLAEISLGQLLLRLFQMAAEFKIEIQPQLILLQKTLLQVEGLGRYLYPSLNLWQTAKPFLERWLRQQLGPKAFLHKIQTYLPLWSNQLPEWPQLIYNALQRKTTPAAGCMAHRSSARGFWQGFMTALLVVSLALFIVIMVKLFVT